MDQKHGCGKAIDETRWAVNKNTDSSTCFASWLYAPILFCFVCKWFGGAPSLAPFPSSSPWLKLLLLVTLTSTISHLRPPKTFSELLPPLPGSGAWPQQVPWEQTPSENLGILIYNKFHGEAKWQISRIDASSLLLIPESVLILTTTTKTNKKSKILRC